MKTQILQLESHDDAISTRDKLAWSQTGRVLLVWPNRGRVLVRRLDLILLLRQCQALGVQLALVTEDPDVRYHARQLGISMFQTVRQAQQSRWLRPIRRKALRRLMHVAPSERAEIRQYLIESAPQRQFSSKSLPQAFRFLFFVLGLLAVFSIGAAFYPRAEIQLTPVRQAQAIELAVQASPETSQVNLSGILPARTIGVLVEGQDSLETSGSMQIPLQPATGQVIFTNLTDQSMDIPAGTVVGAPGSSARFATDRSGRVASGPGTTIALPVTALTPGSRGNLPPESIQAIEGQLGTSLAVTNPQPTSGGTDQISPAVTPLDQTRLYNQLAQVLQNEASADIQDLLTSGDIILTPEPSLARTVEKSFDPASLGPASQLNLTLRQEYQASKVTREDLERLVTGILDANLPSGYIPLPGTLEILHLTTPRSEADRTARWRLRASRTLQANLPESQVISLSLGRSLPQASQKLAEALDLSSPPKIHLTPDWWPRLPLLPFRIAVSTNLDSSN